MREYEVDIEAMAPATTTVKVTAEDADEAEKIAKEQCIGSAEWKWGFPMRHDIIHARVR